MVIDLLLMDIFISRLGNQVTQINIPLIIVRGMINALWEHLQSQKPCLGCRTIIIISKKAFTAKDQLLIRVAIKLFCFE